MTDQNNLQVAAAGGATPNFTPLYKAGSTQIIRLNGKNYSSWKFILRKIIIQRKLAKVVFEEEDTSLTSDQASSNDFQAWELITSSLEQNVLDKVVVCDTAREIWDRLKRIYELEGDANLNSNFVQFCTLTMKQSDEMSDYIAKLDMLVDKIKNQGESLSEKLIQAKLVSSLTPDYDVFRQVWDSTPIKTY